MLLHHMRQIGYILLITAFAAVVLAGPEYSVGKPAYGPAPGDHWSPSVATDGSAYLVAWRDGRTGVGDRVMFTRVSRSGDVLDPIGHVIGEGVSSSPQAVWTGSKYLVVWGSNGRLLAVTISRDGEASTPRVIAENAFLTSSRSVVSDGTATLVVHLRGQPPAPRAVVLDREGNVVRDVELAPAGPQRSDLSAATNGSEFMVAWSVYTGASSDAEVLRVARDGTPIGEPRNIGFGAGPLLASDGDDYVLVARRHHSGLYTWSSRRLESDLSDVTPPLPIPQGNTMTEPSLVWNGTEYLFIAQLYSIKAGDPYLLAAVRIGQHGRPVENAFEVENISIGGGVDPGARVATNGSTLLAAWIDSDLIEQSGRETRVVARLYSDSSLAPLTNERLLSVGANRQLNPVLAFDDTTALVVWRESRGIYATRVTADGRSLDERGMQLTASPAAAGPQVVFDGIHWVVAWLERGALEIRFITPFGDVRSDTIRMTGVSDFALGSTSRHTLLAWTDNESRLMATRINRETRTADGAPVAVSPAGAVAWEPDISWNGRETLIAWTEVMTGFWHGPTYDPIRILGARLSSSFTLIDTAPIVIGDTPQNGDSTPSVASNSDDWLVTWINGNQELRANRVLRSGNITGPVEGTHLAANQMFADVTFDGDRYAVASRDFRALRVGYLPADGPLAFSALQILGDMRSSQPDVAIVRGGASAVVAYSRVSDALEHTGVERAFIRYVEPVKKTRAVR